MKRVLLLVVLIACLACVSAQAVDTDWAVAPDLYPYSAIAYMDVHKSCGCSGLYTGFMVAPDLMMTAASALACSEHGGKVDRMECYFGYLNDDYYLAHFSYSGQAWKAGTYFDEIISRFPGIESRYDADKDYAFMRVDSAIGQKTGWFGLGSWDKKYLAGAMEELAGYSDGILMTNYTLITAGNTYLEPFNTSWKTDPNGQGVGSPVFDAYYNVLGVLTNRAITEARCVTDEMLAMADSLSSSNPNHTPSQAYDPADYSGETLEGTWRLVRTEVAGEDKTNPNNKTEFLFKDGRWKTRSSSGGEWGDGIPYHYARGTLYKYTDSPYEALVTVSGDTMTFRERIDITETYQRVDGVDGSGRTAAPQPDGSADAASTGTSGDLASRVSAVERELGISGAGLSLNERVIQAENMLGFSSSSQSAVVDRVAALERELGIGQNAQNQNQTQSDTPATDGTASYNFYKNPHVTLPYFGNIIMPNRIIVPPKAVDIDDARTRINKPHIDKDGKDTTTLLVSARDNWNEWIERAEAWGFKVWSNLQIDYYGADAGPSVWAYFSNDSDDTMYHCAVNYGDGREITRFNLTFEKDTETEKYDIWKSYLYDGTMEGFSLRYLKPKTEQVIVSASYDSHWGWRFKDRDGNEIDNPFTGIEKAFDQDLSTIIDYMITSELVLWQE